MSDEISKRAKITSCPDHAAIKARLLRDGEVFLTVKEITENAYAIVFVEPEDFEKMRTLIGGLK